MTERQLSLFLTYLWLCFGLMSCSHFKRHPDSGYDSSNLTDSSHANDFYRQRQWQEEQEASEELGLVDRQPQSEETQTAIEQRIKLKRMERQIPTLREKKQYYRYKNSLPNDLARIHFLQIPTVEGREKWFVQLEMINEDQKNYSDEMTKLIENNEIVLNMSQKAVRESWGDPEIIEVAGNSMYLNECWKYSKYVSSQDGYRRETRLIYFEGGKVVGWETQ